MKCPKRYDAYDVMGPECPACNQGYLYQVCRVGNDHLACAGWLDKDTNEPSCCKHYVEKYAPKDQKDTLLSGRCEHDVDGTDCFKCHPTKEAKPDNDFQLAAAFTCIAPHSYCGHQQADCVLVPGGSARGEQADAIRDLLSGESAQHDYRADSTSTDKKEKE